MLDPATIPAFAVLQIHFQYEGQPAGMKIFVALWHEEIAGIKTIICIKATSNVDRYVNDSELFNGCVFYPKGEISFFPEPTVIQPENRLALKYGYIEEHDKKGQCRILGTMPGDFKEELKKAINACPTLQAKAKKTMLEKLGP